MEQVIKVSISGVSFTLEKGAYTLLEEYLADLKAAYSSEENYQEIIDDIEERIAELILEWGVKERVVSCAEISNIIGILGHPGDIKSEDPESSAHKNGKTSVKRKLYRNLSNKVLGGVCGGLGAYFGADPVIIRIVLVLLALLALKMGRFEIMVFVYLLFWLIVPSAKTVGQKCQMYGCSTKIDDIQKRVRSGAANIKDDGGVSSRLLRKGFGIVGLCLGCIMLVAGLLGLLAGMFFVFGFEIIEGISPLSILDYIKLGVENTLLIKVLAILVYTVPFLGLLYLGLLLCFKFKSPAWRPGLIMFIIWIASAFSLGALAVKSAAPYWGDEMWSDDKPIPSGIDTLYVNIEPFGGIEKAAKINGLYNDCYVVKKGKGDVEIVEYPAVSIVRHAPEEDGLPYKGFVECKYKVHNNLSLYKTSTFSIDSILTMQDSLVTLFPKIYSKQNKFDGEYFSICVHVPNTMAVIKRDEQGKVTTYNE